jgi:hypothetical protein
MMVLYDIEHQHIAVISDKRQYRTTNKRQKQGAAEKKTKENSRCTYVLYLGRIGLLYTRDEVIFFIAFLSSSHRETPKNALKKNR